MKTRAENIAERVKNRKLKTLKGLIACDKPITAVTLMYVLAHAFRKKGVPLEVGIMHSFQNYKDRDGLLNRFRGTLKTDKNGYTIKG